MHGIFQNKGEVIAGFGAILAMICILLIDDLQWKFIVAFIAVSIMIYGVVSSLKVEDEEQVDR